MSDMQAIDAYREWKEASAQWLRLANASDDWDGPEMSVLLDRRYQLEDQAIQAAPKDVTSAAVLAAMLWAFDGPACLGQDAKAAEALESSDVAMKMKLRLKELAETVLAPAAT